MPVLNVIGYWKVVQNMLGKHSILLKDLKVARLDKQPNLITKYYVSVPRDINDSRKMGRGKKPVDIDIRSDIYGCSY